MKKISRTPVPEFASEDEERAYRTTADSTRLVDWSRAKRALFPDLKPTVRSISLRLPELLITNVKVLANKRDVPYQTLMKNFLAERVEKEMRSVREENTSCRPKVAGAPENARKAAQGRSRLHTRRKG
jgi:predicted DNA binding CopG/RHH family protein